MIKRRYYVGYYTASGEFGGLDVSTEALTDYAAVVAMQDTLRRRMSRPDLIVLGFSRYDEN